MIIDTNEGTVEFSHEVLCVHELEALVTLLDSGSLVEQEPEITFPLIAYVESFSRKGMFYRLQLETLLGLWTCTCPDFANRGFNAAGKSNGHTCKHIRKHVFN